MSERSYLRPTEEESDEELARGWVLIYSVDMQSPEFSELAWVFDRMSYVTEYLPGKAWRTILTIWSMDQSQRTMQLLSAGPIEDLLSLHGPLFIEKVEAEARRDPSFANLLGGVWQNNMPDDVWARLQAVWDRRGWDGVPE